MVINPLIMEYTYEYIYIYTGGGLEHLYFPFHIWDNPSH